MDATTCVGLLSLTSAVVGTRPAPSRSHRPGRMVVSRCLRQLLVALAVNRDLVGLGDMVLGSKPGADQSAARSDR